MRKGERGDDDPADARSLRCAFEGDCSGPEHVSWRSIDDRTRCVKEGKIGMYVRAQVQTRTWTRMYVRTPWNSSPGRRSARSIREPRPFRPSRPFHPSRLRMPKEANDVNEAERDRRARTEGMGDAAIMNADARANASAI